MIKRNNLDHMVSPVHKNTNEPLILIVRDAIFCMISKNIIAISRGFSREPETFLTLRAQRRASLEFLSGFYPPFSILQNDLHE